MSIQRVTLTVTTPPTSEPVALQDVKDRLRLTDTEDDALITKHISAARRYAERITGMSLAAKVYAAFYDSFPGTTYPLTIPAPPCISVSAVKYLDNTLTQQTWDSSEYTVQLLNTQREAVLAPINGNIYPCPYRIPGAVEVDFTGGFGAEGGPTIPEDWFEGICQLSLHIYEHPEVITADTLKEVPVNLLSFFRTTGKIWSF